MIAIPGNVRVWLATGHTDMRRGFPSLARLVQEGLKRDPHAGDLYVFRGRRGDLIKIIWHDGQGACLFTKRLERGRFLWPSLADGVVTISGTRPASTPGKRDGLPRSVQAATAALDCWFAFQFHGSKSATLLAG